MYGVLADCISSETPHTWGMLTIERWRRPFSSFTAMRQVHRLPGLARHAPGNSASFQPHLCLPRLTKHPEEFPLMLQMRVFRTCTPQLCGALPYSWVRFTTQICTSQQDGNVEWPVVSVASPDLLNSSIAGCSLAQVLYATGRRDVTMVLLLASGVKICRSCLKSKRELIGRPQTEALNTTELQFWYRRMHLAANHFCTTVASWPARCSWQNESHHTRRSGDSNEFCRYS